ncbi:MAG: SUMF1/EgtB/PvdO family nonheme iron enzyme [Candidatus Lernaella stagnicola]|nr:SUMF1/EgtB/PvdO family nonheme iron enzyme [Candidatus Lernaella stagnicola]
MRKTITLIIGVVILVVLGVIAWRVFGAWLLLPPARVPNCPPGFAYYEGGLFEVTRTGPRWPNNRYTYTVDLEPFCLARYEASRPEATAESRGERHFENISPAQIRRGVIPWYRLTWHEALAACKQQGWRLPTFEELQYAATAGDPARVWTFGATWDCRLAEQSWTETCEGQRQREAPGVTGGPFGHSDYGLGVYDLLGNVTEITSTPWDMKCFGVEYFTLFGGGYGSRSFMPNDVRVVPEKPGCLLSNSFAKNAHGEHTHHAGITLPMDDGFRPAADPGEHWNDWTPATEPSPVQWPMTVWYYEPGTGKKKTVDVVPLEAPPPRTPAESQGDRIITEAPPSMPGAEGEELVVPLVLPPPGPANPEKP